MPDGQIAGSGLSTASRARPGPMRSGHDRPGPGLFFSHRAERPCGRFAAVARLEAAGAAMSHRRRSATRALTRSRPRAADLPVLARDGQFSEQVTVRRRPGDWDAPGVGQAARLVFLLAGVSYYKTAAPPVIDLGDTAVTATERGFLRAVLPRRPGRVRLPQRPGPVRAAVRGPGGPAARPPGPGR